MKKIIVLVISILISLLVGIKIGSYQNHKDMLDLNSVTGWEEFKEEDDDTVGLYLYTDTGDCYQFARESFKVPENGCDVEKVNR